MFHRSASALLLSCSLLLHAPFAFADFDPLNSPPAAVMEAPSAFRRLVLLGPGELDWPCGIPFEDPGFIARGVNGEDLSGSVIVEGSPVPWRVGDYTITYLCSEDGGKIAAARRLVHVKAQPLPDVVQPPAGTICLTFDDGPCEYTERCLDILASHNVHATFFIVANQTKYLPLLPKIVEGGHTLGIHCYDHRSYGMLYRDEEHYFTDLLKAQQIIHDYTGQYAQIVRFPGGSITASHLTGTLKGGYQEFYAILHDMGIRPYDWNVQPESATKTVEGTIVDFTHPREPYDYAIVLQHDARRFSVEALDQMLTWALAEGYSFSPLDTTFPEILFN